jgi:hypothetical protein
LKEFLTVLQSSSFQGIYFHQKTKLEILPFLLFLGALVFLFTIKAEIHSFRSGCLVALSSEKPVGRGQ